MVVVMVVTTAMRIITLAIVMMMMLVAMTMWVMTFAMFMMIVIVVVMLFLYIAFYLLNPCSRGSHLIEVEEFGIKYLRERHIAIIAVYDFSFRLDSAKDSANMLTFLGRHLRYLV